MNTAPAMACSMREDIARDLIIRILDETEQARALELTAHGDLFDVALAARVEMLEAVEKCVRTIAAASHDAQGAMIPATRQTLIGLANELERADATLLDQIRTERDLIAAALLATNRPDGIASRYAESAPVEAHRLNLIR